MTNESTQAILVLSDKNTVETRDFYEEIKKSSSAVNGEAFLLFHNKRASDCFYDYPGITYHFFTDNVLSSLGYTPIAETLIPGSNHFPLFDFYLANPFFDFYWVIEDDVRFNGEWEFLFKDFTNENTSHDFLTSHISNFKHEPYWYWWNTFKITEQPALPQNKLLRSFNPIYRLSNRAMAYVHQMMLKQCVGHHEVLIPTLLSNAGYSLLDFGGTGKFVTNGYQNKYYTEHVDRGGSLKDPGTMRYRPIMNKVGDEKNKLYHPIKPNHQTND